MKSSIAIPLLILVASVTGCQNGLNGPGPPPRSSIAKGATQFPGTGNPVEHAADLSWLVGRWRCISRTFLSEGDLLNAATGSTVLEYFNVFYPYADDRLTLKLTPSPDDRPIAAEFLVRHVYADLQEQLRPMFGSGSVRIGSNRIWYGWPLLEDFDFEYHVWSRFGTDWLVLQSRSMRFELVKISDDAGDIRQSFVVAPIREYSVERINELRQRYEELKAAARQKTLPSP